jgi:hypothetical protein
MGGDAPNVEGGDTGERIAVVRERRERLREALVELEQALSGAAGRSESWGDRVAPRVKEFHAALNGHIAMTEGDGGLFAQVLRESPRLDSVVKRLRKEHEDMLEAATKLLERCQGDLTEPEDVEGLRDDGMDLLRLAARHRQRGADLLYSAYEVDIAAGD